jgi:Xaa-Pro aminopeptidase
LQIAYIPQDNSSSWKGHCTVEKVETYRAQIDPPNVDLTRLRAYRLERIREQLRAAEAAFAILVNPISLRYAIDCREYQGIQSRIPFMYLFVAADGPAVMYGTNYGGFEGVDDYRPATRNNAFEGGLDLADNARLLADDVTAFMHEIGLKNDTRRVAVEMFNPSVTQALLQAGIDPIDAEPLVERARSIKSAEEIQCMRHSIAVAEHGFTRMRDATEPGIRETELWALLHQVNVAHDGDWFDGRMLCSGPRTNPWMQEATAREVEAGDLVAFDSDMIGPFGYCADISRTWLCGPAEPTPAQRDVYQRTFDEVHHNIELVRPGVTFFEFTDKAFRQPEEFIARRYPTPCHGIGMSDEYPKIFYRQDVHNAYDGVIEENMTLCVESYCGSERGGPGVKLEQMVLVTDSGCELLSQFPFETELLGSSA